MLGHASMKQTADTYTHVSPRHAPQSSHAPQRLPLRAPQASAHCGGDVVDTMLYSRGGE